MTGPVTGTAASWADMLPYMDAEGLRELLGEGGAAACHRHGVGDLQDRESWPAVAAVLAMIHGADPMALVR